MDLSTKDIGRVVGLIAVAAAAGWWRRRHGVVMVPCAPAAMPSTAVSPSSKGSNRSGGSDSVVKQQQAPLPSHSGEDGADGEGDSCWAHERHSLWQMFLALSVCGLVWSSSTNNLVDQLLHMVGMERVDFDKLNAEQKLSTIDCAPLVMLLPLAGLAWHDMHSVSKRFLFMIPDQTMNYVLRVAGGYGIVQVLAQDLGLPSGINQRNIVQHPAVQFLMLWGGAYALTGHRSEGMISALLYFVLKVNVSGGQTANVCFEEV